MARGSGRKVTRKGPLPDDLPVIPPEVVKAEIGDVGKAKKEDELFKGGEPVDVLEREANEKEAKRQQTFLAHFESVNICAMWAVAVAMAVLGVTWLAHMVLPAKCEGYIHVCRWLEPDEITVIQDILTGGLIAGLVADHFRRRLNFHKKDDK